MQHRQHLVALTDRPRAAGGRPGANAKPAETVTALRRTTRPLALPSPRWRGARANGCDTSAARRPGEALCARQCGKRTAPARSALRRAPERQREVAGAVGPERARWKPAARSGFSSPARVNFVLISVRISSPAAKRTGQAKPADLAPRGRRAPAGGCRPAPARDRSAATWSNSVLVERGAQIAVQDAQHVLVELDGHARRVVVGGVEPPLRLHQVGAQQEPVTGAQHRRAAP